MLTTFNDVLDLLKKVISFDESWVYGYGIKTKAQSSQWKSQDRKNHIKFDQVLLTVFLDCNGMVHNEFLPQGRTVNKDC